MVSKWRLVGLVIETALFIGVIVLALAIAVSSYNKGSIPRCAVSLSAAIPVTVVVRVPVPSACDCESDCGRAEPAARIQLPHFVLGVGTLRVAATKSRIVADDRVHSLKARLKGTGWSRHLRVRPAAGHSGVRFAVDVTQVEADAGTVFCRWLETVHQWNSGPYPCEIAY